MKKETRRLVLLALGGMILFSFLVSCVSLEKMGLRKGKQEAAPAASQTAPAAQQQQQANVPEGGSTAPQPGVGTTQGTMKPMPVKQGREQYFVHQVKWPNESLSIIAKWYTGSLMNWKALAKANPDMKPTVIHKGDRIRIPVNMLKTRDPMPEVFVDELIQSLKKKTSVQGAQEKKQEEEEPALFGPKGAEEQ